MIGSYEHALHRRIHNVLILVLLGNDRRFGPFVLRKFGRFGFELQESRFGIIDELFPPVLEPCADDIGRRLSYRGILQQRDTIQCCIQVVQFIENISFIQFILIVIGRLRRLFLLCRQLLL